MYKVVYLPTARQQLMNAVLYIAEELSSPDAAASLLDEVDDQISKLSEYPYRHRIYPLVFAMNHYQWSTAGAISLGLILIVWLIDILSGRVRYKRTT